MSSLRSRMMAIATSGGVLLRLLAAGGALAAVLALAPVAVQAATFTVVPNSNDTVDASPGNGVCADGGGICSLRAAIMEANALAGADTITLPAGTYTLTRSWVNPGDGIIEADASNGDLDLNSDITINGAGAGSSIIQGAAGWNDGIMDVNSNLVRASYLGQPLPTPGNVSINGVTIQGGNSSEPLQNGGEGGGIGVAFWGAQGSFSISNSIVQNNYSLHGYGGGIGILNGQAASKVEGQTVNITNTQFINNTAYDAAGGGLFAGGYVPVNITGSTFSGNRSGGASPRNLVPGGGGIYLEESLAVSTITNTTISGNTTDDGTADDSDGGGIAIARPLTMKNSTVSGNIADRNGAGMFFTLTGARSATLINVTISGNNAKKEGAGLHAQLETSGGTPSLTLTNVTITGNHADSDNNNTGSLGGGIFRQAEAVPGNFLMQNTIVAGNYRGSGTTTPDDATGVLSGTYNLFGTGGSGTLSGGTGNIYNVADARLGALANNGGPVQTHALLPGSPALDAGSNALNSETTDARGAGYQRKLDGADADTTQEIDMGALEQHPIVEDLLDRTMLQDTSVTYNFNLGESALGFTSITATSSNTALVPNNPANLSISAGSGAGNRNLNITPVSGGYGTTTISVTATAVYNGNTFTSTDTFLLTVQRRPDLTLSKSHAGSFRQGDKNKSYTLTVNNKAGQGPSLRPSDPLAPVGTTDITVSDTLPAGLTVAAAATKWSGTNWSCTTTSTTYTCTYAAVVNGGNSSQPLTLFVDVDDNAGTPVTNNAGVTGGAELPSTQNDNSAADVTVVIQTADLTVDKTHTDPFKQGETGKTFNLRVANIGPGPTDATFTVTDTLPAGLTPTGVTPQAGQGWSCNIAGQTVTCSRTTVNPLVNGTFSDITVTVDVARDAATTAPNQLANTASVSGGGELASRTGNNTSTDTVNITQMPDLTVAKVANGTFRQGQQATYTLTVTNSGYAPTDGTTVTVTDTLPAGLTYSSGTGPGWSCSASGQTVTCTSTAVVAASGTFPAITLTVDVAGNAGSPVVNAASVTGGGQIYTANDGSGNVSTTVVKAPDLAITKTHSGTWTQGDLGKTYTITVANKAGQGPTFQPITVTDTLPTGLTYVSATGTGWTCGATGQLVTCTSNDVVNGGSALPTITLTVNVAANAGTPLVNGVQVMSNGELAGTLTDNSTTDSTNIVQLPDLVVTKSHTDPFQQGQTGAQYTITVTNQGTGPTSGTVTVTDTLPTGLTYVGGSGTGWTCSAAGQVVTCTSTGVITAGGNSTITLTVNVAPNAATASPYQLVNSVAVTGGGEQAGQTGNNSNTDTTTITQMPDLTIAKAANGTFRQGQAAAYTVTVTNSGYAATSGTITVTDTLPAGIAYSSSAGTGWTCSASGQDVTCTSTDAIAAAGNSSFTLNVTVAGNAGTPVVNTAHVAGGGQINTANDDSAPVSTTVVKVPDLAVTKTHSGTWTQGDTNKPYTITVSNNAAAGPTYDTVTVTDTLPTGLTYNSASGIGWACSASGQTVTCTTSNVIAAGGNSVITLTVNVAPTAGTPLSNGVSVATAGELSTTLSDNSTTDSTDIVQLPDLQMTKSDGGASFQQGQTGATYTLTVANLGTGTTTNPVTVSDTLASDLTYVSATGTGWTCTYNSGTRVVSCSPAAALAPGSSSVITLTVDVVRNAATGTDVLSNTATVSVTGDTNAGNNASTETTTVEAMPDLTVAKAANGTFRQGQPAAYTVTVTNSGFAPTSGTITVTDTLPAGLSYSGFAGTGWTCNATGQDVTCTSTDVIAAAGTSAITLTVTVADNAGTPVVNTAHVAGGGQIYTANDDSASVSTTVVQAPDLAVTKTHSGTWTQGDSGKSYTITVSNKATAGPTAGTITVTDTLPTGLTYASGTGTGWSCSASGQTVTCTTSNVIAAGGSTTITLNVNVAANAGTPLVNSVTVSGGSELNATTGDNTTTDSTDIVQLPDLVVTKAHNGATFTQGKAGEQYTITVTNQGTGTTGTNTITVTDTLPAGLTPKAWSSTDGFTCTISGQDVSCTRSTAMVANDTAEITLTVDVATNAATTAPHQLTNTANVSGGGEQAGQTGNNSGSDTVTVTQKPDLTVVKTAIGTFHQGYPAGYTITVTNSGYAPTDGSTITVTDTLPAGLSFSSGTGTGWSCDASGQVVTCTSTGLIGAGNDSAITLNVNVADNAGTPVDNTAHVSGGGEINTANNDSTTISTTVEQAPDLTVALTANGPFEQNTNGTYTINVTNAGLGPTFQTATVTDVLPAALSYVSGAGTGWTCSYDSGTRTVTCTSNDAVNGGSPYPAITLTVGVASTAPPSVSNTVSVSGGGELVTTNNTDTKSVHVIQHPDLTIAKTHTDPFAQGQTGATYTLTVKNVGTGETEDTITVTDSVPADIDVTAVTSTDFTCSFTDQDVTCTRTAAMVAGTTEYTITVTGDVSKTAPATVTNTASVAVTGDVGNSNNSDDDLTNIAQKANLTVTKSHTGDFRQGQQGAQYLIKVHNAGTGPTEGTVTVTDNLPADLTYVGYTGVGWSCSAAGQIVTCTTTVVKGPGTDFDDLVISVKVSPTAVENLTNTVAVDGGGEVITGDNTASDPTMVTQVANLKVAKTHSGSWTQGDTGKAYTITVTNNGTGPTDAPVTVTDVIPTGLEYVSAAGTGWTSSYNSATRTVTATRSDVLAAGASYPAITVTVNVTATAPPTVTNTAAVSGGGEAITDDNSGPDPTTIIQKADLSITKTHAQEFHLGLKDAKYTIVVTNVGFGATSGTVTVTDTLPLGLTKRKISGTGWTCVLTTLTCTRSDSLSAGGSYPPITVTVDVPGKAPDKVTNHAEVSGGGDLILSNNAADDLTNIAPAPPRPKYSRMVRMTVPMVLTRESWILVSGTADANAVISVAGMPVQVDGDGNWTATVPLQEGPNLIVATNGETSDSATVVRDTISPVVTLSASATVTSGDTVLLTATSEPGALVRINGQDGATRQVKLAMGTNTFTATATDQAGNTGTVSLTVTRVAQGQVPVSREVEPEKPADVVHQYWAIHLPSQAVTETVLVTVQTPGSSDATKRAEAIATLLSVTQIEAVTQDDNTPVHQLSKQVILTFTYDPARVADPTKLQIYYYDPAVRAWVALESVVDTRLHTVTGKTDHFSLFAAMAVAQAVPTLDALPATVSQPALRVTGKGEPGATVSLRLNGAVAGNGVVDKSGSFSLNVTLSEGQNRIQVVSAGGALASGEAMVTYQPPVRLTDVDGHWANQAITEMVGLGVVKGYEDSTFRPENQVTRAEFAVMLGRLLRLPASTASLPFTDAAQVPDWARPAVAAMVEAGIAITQPDGSFGPNVPATRVEMAVMLARALQYKGYTLSPASRPFTDASQIPAWAKDLVSAAANAGLIKGYPDGSFLPGNPASRAEAVTMFSRLRKLLSL